MCNVKTLVTYHRKPLEPQWVGTCTKCTTAKVFIVGSKKNELFEISRVNDNETAVNVYKINKEGEKKSDPFYSRTFKIGETKEIRLYGLNGNDVFYVDSQLTSRIKVRMIESPTILKRIIINVKNKKNIASP